MKRNLTQFPESTPVSDLCKYDEVKDWEKIPRSVGLYSTGKRIPRPVGSNGNKINIKQNHRTLSDWNLIARVVYIICMACRCLVIGCVHYLHWHADALLFLACRKMAYMVTILQLQTCRWMVPLLPSPHFKTPSRYGHFSFISRRILSNALESIFYIEQNTSAIFGNQRKFRVNGFWVKLWSYWESFKIIYI